MAPRRGSRRVRRSRRPPPHGEDQTLPPTLDLHGATAEYAVDRAARWIAAQRAAGVRRVRIVTGRGAHSAGLPVLRGEIDHLLGGLRGTSVADFALDAGGGAFWVELRRPNPAPATRRSASAAPRQTTDDDALRRQAEEALAELGITPTPDLVRAEMRRLSGGSVEH